MDQTNIVFDKTQECILKDIQTLSHNFDITDNNNNLIKNAFTIMQYSNKLLYNYVGIMCKKIWNYLNENKKTKIMHDDNYISLTPNIPDLTKEEFEEWDRVLVLTDEINGFSNFKIIFDKNITQNFINEFLNYFDTLSATPDILLFYYVYTTRNINFTTIEDLKNLINSSKSEVEDVVFVKCTTDFALDYKYNIINYYYEIFILNSQTDILIDSIWNTEENYNNKQNENISKPDKFDIFNKLFNNNSLGKSDMDELGDGDMGDILKNAMMSMFGGLGGLGGLGGMNKKEENSDGDVDDDDDDDDDDDVDDDIENDPDIQSIEKLISNIADSGHLMKNGNNLD
jgi:hypothetical protein